MKKATPLKLIDDPSSIPSPPRPLAKHGLALWHSVNSEYAIDDAGGVEMLAQACEALDVAQECAARRAKEGLTIETEAGRREHPLMKIELQNRAFVVRTLRSLGLNFEPLRNSAGRPPALA